MQPAKRYQGKIGDKKDQPRDIRITFAIDEIVNPNITPTTPPARPNAPDSNKNILNISEFLAPIDFITPISLTRSKTDVTIVLAVFIADTITETKAMRITKYIITFKDEV